MADPTTVERMRLVAEGLRDLRERGEMVFEDEALMLVEAATRCVEAEREACAKLCEELSRLSREAANKHYHDDFRCHVASSRAHAAHMLAEKIRARGKES